MHGVTGLVMSAAVFATAGCSYVPDALNPVEWYNDVVGLFEDEETIEAREVARAPVPGAPQRYPSLATVPPRPAGASTPEQRTVIASGLVADRRQARAAAQSMPTGVPVTAPAPTFASQIATAPAQPPAPTFARQVATPPIQPPSPLPAPAAGTPRRGGSGALVDQTYRSQLALSAPTVSTAPAGPTASPSLTGGRPAPLSAIAAATPPSSALPLAPSGSNGSAVSYRAASLFFKTGSARLGKGDRKKLREVAALQRKRNATLRIIGHASSRTRDLDPVKHQIVNFRISVDRAHVVARELVRLGVPAGKLTIGAKSDQERVFYEFMPAGETGNQRTEIYIEY
jgi:outer membrane protein OmpA-like peptidoglycan-associated protein